MAEICGNACSVTGSGTRNTGVHHVRRVQHNRGSYTGGACRPSNSTVCAIAERIRRGCASGVGNIGKCSVRVERYRSVGCGCKESQPYTFVSLAITPFAGSDTLSVMPATRAVVRVGSGYRSAEYGGTREPSTSNATIIYANVSQHPGVVTTPLVDRLNSRSYTGRAGAPAATEIYHHVVHLALRPKNTSLCTRGRPGSGLPSSAINWNPVTVVVAPAPFCPVVCDPTIAGTCIRKPAFTMRTKTVAVTPVSGRPEQRGCRISLAERDSVDRVIHRREVHSGGIARQTAGASLAHDSIGCGCGRDTRR